MTNKPNDFTDDIYNLNILASEYLLKNNNLLSNLDATLKMNRDCARLIDKYNTVSNLLSLGQPGPGWLEITSPLYFWSILTLSNELKENININTAAITNNNNLLKHISEKQIPDIISKLDKLISLVNGIQTLISTSEQKIVNLLDTTVRTITAHYETIINYLNNELTNLLKEVLDKLNNVIEKFKENIQSLFEENLDIFSENTSEKASLKIVGESYYKWDSENIYAPTLKFLFEEDIVQLQRRRSQISMKLPYTRETLPEDIVLTLKNRIQRRGLLEYFKGNLKSTFVHPEYKWRTTFLVKTRYDSRKILRYLSNIGGIDCRPRGLSYTEGRISLRHTRLRREIPGVTLRERTNEGEYLVKLSRVVLLISNSDSPIVIWKKIP